MYIAAEETLGTREGEADPHRVRSQRDTLDEGATAGRNAALTGRVSGQLTGTISYQRAQDHTLAIGVSPV
ncbi:MAG: hypothetical protein EBE86_026665 [Hormoscilla sp. GUM202]|nr:hypothetical protein [Hormoscilla sp. GUM202]